MSKQSRMYNEVKVWNPERTNTIPNNANPIFVRGNSDWSAAFMRQVLRPMAR